MKKYKHIIKNTLMIGVPNNYRDTLIENNLILTWENLLAKNCENCMIKGNFFINVLHTNPIFIIKAVIKFFSSNKAI